MKRTVLRYGIYATLTIVTLSAAHFFIIMPNVKYDNGEIAGYLTMILSMVFVFAGIRYYRDRVNNGSLSFGQGLKVGVLIILIPSVSFGLFDILYTEVLNPSWSADYIRHYEEKIKAAGPPAVADKKLKKLHDDMEMFGNPLFQFLLMSVTVFIIGFIATIISSLALMRKRKPIVA
jgi:Protein of unknown function (DUF4199)